MLGRFRIPLVALGVVGVGGAAGFFSPTSEGPSEIVFLSVGQGDCTIIRDNGLTAMVDAGPSPYAGDRLIASKLRARKIQRIDVLMLTHPDLDHIGGLGALSRRISIGRLVVPAHFRDNLDIKAAILGSRIKPDAVLWLSGRSEVQLGEAKLSLFVPNWTPDEADNEGSMFVKVAGPDGTIAVLSGDAGQDTEIEMLEEADWQATILKAGHHGSGSSASYAWFREVAPKVVVVSCGAGNAFGHPHKGVLQRAALFRSKVMRTDMDGDIAFPLSGAIPLRRR